MTKFLPHKRACLVNIPTSLLLGISLMGCNSSQSNTVGKFTPPVLSGWSQIVSKSDFSERAVYNKVAQNNRLRISLMLLKIPAVRSVQEMQKVINGGGHATMPSSTKSVQVKQFVEQATSLNGMPAVLTQTTYKTSRFNSNSKSLRFADGAQTYLLTATRGTASTVPFSPQAQTELDQAWKTISQQLVP